MCRLTVGWRDRVAGTVLFWALRRIVLHRLCPAPLNCWTCLATFVPGILALAAHPGAGVMPGAIPSAGDVTGRTSARNVIHE